MSEGLDNPFDPKLIDLQLGNLSPDERAELMQRIVASGLPVEVLYVAGQWFDVDSIEDLAESYNMASRSNRKRSMPTSPRLAPEPVRRSASSTGATFRTGSN